MPKVNGVCFGAVALAKVAINAAFFLFWFLPAFFSFSRVQMALPIFELRLLFRRLFLALFVVAY